MADCSILPVLGTPQAATTVEPAVQIDADAIAFTVDGVAIDDTEDLEVPEDAVDIDAALDDPLQLLIEVLSGITGNIREKAADSADAEADEAALQTTAAKTQPAPRIDATAVAEAPAEVAAVLTASADQATLSIDTATMDAPALRDAVMQAPPAARSDAPVAEPHAARTAPAPIARQIAEAVVTTRDEVVEIALSPEELGRVRMIVSGPEHSPHVVVWAERPEVLDQLRRNATFLQECFGDAGLADASFEFDGDARPGTRDNQPAQAETDHLSLGPVEHVQIVPMAWTPMAIPARLDIRI